MCRVSISQPRENVSKTPSELKQMTNASRLSIRVVTKDGVACKKAEVYNKLVNISLKMDHNQILLEPVVTIFYEY